jgi:hypothetical protein
LVRFLCTLRNTMGAIRLKNWDDTLWGR